MSVENDETLDDTLAGYSPDRSAPAKVRRRLIQWLHVAPMPRAPRRPIVSFTFDDFPRSAADTGAAIVESGGGRAGFYAATGLAGKRNATGEQFTAGDLDALVAAGHEIGAHTHSHLDCAKAGVKTVLDEIEANRAALAQMGLASPPGQFAYPFGETTVALKSALKGAVQAARGVLPGVNRRGSDLMQLRALELTPESWTTDRAAKAIAAATRRPAWVVVFTHDVRERPSDYGTTPAALRRLVRLAADSGADILPPGEALATLDA